MKVLVVGGGGREHALCWKLAQSPKLDRLFCAPGNAGIAQVAECVDLGSEDFSALVDFAREQAIDLAVVGPEVPLVAGIVDTFQAAGLKIFGPNQAAAQLEGSKVFAKQFMQRHGIPTARFKLFASFKDAAVALKEYSFPVVVKASGLAAGKGVIICADRDQATDALKEMLLEHRFGEAGAQVVVEEYLEGEEASILALTDSRDYLCLPSSQDHKRLLDGDQGPNTGGMGAYSPAPVVTPALQAQIEATILKPTLAGMSAEGHPFTGCLYLGIIFTRNGPQVLEYNCRFGDPETQAVLPLYDGDLLDACLATVENRVGQIPAPQPSGAAVCVVLASGGYPRHYEKGKPITGLEELPEKVTAFHAGTRRDDGGLVTDGGRVLGITARADDLQSAVCLAFQGVSRVHFAAMHYRRDIARRALGK
ncbi:MAG: phosphoribosylamine--glycine ligase [Candidatus Zixiibacteriota bacterium]|nr:MAG: phosphoribosylamine--glycine ligase [candidate division Zixibacteria bacterium]